MRGIPAYLELFRGADASIAAAGDLSIVHIANALGDFMNSEWRSTDSAFDRSLAGDGSAMSPPARAGMELFFGKAGCASCHSGPLLSDQGFHALALPHFGPGRTRRFDPYVRDVGRMAESDRLEDAYRFRTPMLRNVALTGPWGHNGAYATLEGIVRHHLDPIASLEAWTPDMVLLPHGCEVRKGRFHCTRRQPRAGAAEGAGRYRAGHAFRCGGLATGLVSQRLDREREGTSGTAACRPERIAGGLKRRFLCGPRSPELRIPSCVLYKT
ncbi:hypothetical protein OEG86_02000 [Hoeflea alexandrii]|uniref:cytochrome-c peroxidase n=1 Tax=Hoeflea alexandrii TaxID=288436 RepID=UPI00226FD857|nr:hypothetical protein [Hoeflea alexandrii]MCY0151234.1 hypothetical protein [Hoeflea alexandrii]